MFGYLKTSLLIFAVCYFSPALAQYDPQFYMRSTEAQERQKTHERIIENVIKKNFSMHLDSTTEENWEGAMNAMEVVAYHDAGTWQKMQEAMENLAFHSLTFQRYTLEAAYAVYPGYFVHEAIDLMRSTADPKIFAMCAVYLAKSGRNDTSFILGRMRETFGDTFEIQPILSRLNWYLSAGKTDYSETASVLKVLLNKSFLPGQVVMFSFQRRNRDYPGMVIVRKGDGEFVRDATGIFHVPQLGRGIADLPYFLTKGNTPQGICRMYGFGVSQSLFIGPTANVQMGMPFELSKEKFFGSVRVGDSNWTIREYADLIPPSARHYEPLFESYYAGAAGRNEIIAHGTTINPELYKGKPYYPLTPTEGCLSTKELWNGKIIESDQQLLVNALLKASGAKGFAVVIDIDDGNAPVAMKDIQKYLPAGK